MKIELHCHSTCSDGSEAPEDVARRAAARGVELFCLTDHDTCAGYEATRAVLDGPTVLCGMELSCRWHRRTIHLLVIGMVRGAGFDALAARLDQVAKQRRGRIRAICERLAGLGIELDADAILAEAGHEMPGRPHVARALVEAGVVTSIREAFTRFLNDRGPANVPLAGIELAEGLDLACQTGAKVALAHPHTLGGFALVRDLFVRFGDAGLGGIEAYYGSYGPAAREGWLRLADDLDLVVTGGSDFHGDTLPDIAQPVIDLPSPHSDRLLEWLGATASSSASPD